MVWADLRSIGGKLEGTKRQTEFFTDSQIWVCGSTTGQHFLKLHNLSVLADKKYNIIPFPHN